MGGAYSWGERCGSPGHLSQPFQNRGGMSTQRGPGWAEVWDQACAPALGLSWCSVNVSEWMCEWKHAFHQGSQDTSFIGTKRLRERKTKLQRQNHQTIEGHAEYLGLDPTGSSSLCQGRGWHSKLVFGKNNLRVVWSQVGMEKTKNTVKSQEP